MQSVSEPLYLTTSFQKKSKLHPDRDNYSYSRIKNPNYDTLEHRLVELYPGSEEALLFPSGMNAIAILLEQNICDNISYIIGEEVYYEIFKVLNYLGSKYKNFSYHIVNIKNTQRIKELIEDFRVKLIFFDSASNPSGYIPDFEEINKIKSCNKCVELGTKFVIDNSWMSGALFNPFEYGVDIVIESLSKYIGGGRIIMGALLGKHIVLKQIIEYKKMYGVRVSQYDAWSVSEMILSLPHRMRYISEISYVIAKYLQNHNKVVDIRFPALENHLTHDRYLKYFKRGCPGVMYFKLRLTKDEAIKFSDQSDIILYATSYGKPDTMIDPDFEEDDDGTWIRLSIGWASDKNKIMEELSRLLEMI